MQVRTTSFLNTLVGIGFFFLFFIAFLPVFAQEEDLFTENPELNQVIRLGNQYDSYATLGDAVWLVALGLFEDLPSGVTNEDIAQFLVSKNVLKQSDINKLDRKITKGLLAKMILKSLGLKGGISYSIFGGGRYAFRECQYLNIMPATGSPYQKLTGVSLLSLIQVAKDYQLSKILKLKTLEDITEEEEEEE